MSELHVRNLPAELHQRLRAQAAAEGRSMSAEAIILLRHALQAGADPLARQRAAIDRLAEIRTRSRLPADAALAERLLREDRDAAE